MTSYFSPLLYKPSLPLVKIITKNTLRFARSHYINEIYYNSRIINDIIYNEKSHIVSLFKDHLILDDCSEFLKRYYMLSESAIRLPRFFEYHETYSRIYPNYTALPESKFIYKNIHRKQKIIDQQQNQEITNDNKQNKQKNSNDVECKYEQNVLSTGVCNSLANDSSLVISMFGLVKKKCNNTKDKNSNYVDNNSNNNINNGDDSVNDIKKIVNIIDKHQRAQLKNSKSKKQCNGNINYSSIKPKQQISILSKLNSNTARDRAIQYNNTLITSNQYLSRKHLKHKTALSKDLHKKYNINCVVNDLQLPKSTSITANNSLISTQQVFTHKKTISAQIPRVLHKTKIKVNTNNTNILSSSSRIISSKEKIKTRIKHMSNSNTNNNSIVSNSSINNSKITHRNRTIPKNNNTLCVHMSNNSINSYKQKHNNNHINNNKHNHHHLKNSSSNLIKQFTKKTNEQHSHNHVISNNKSGCNTERASSNKLHKGSIDMECLHKLITKTKMTYKTKINKATSVKASSVMNNNNNNRGIISSRTNLSSKQLLSNNIINNKTKNKISVNVLNKNTLSHKNIFHNNMTHQHNDKINTHCKSISTQLQTQKHVIKGIQIKNFGKAMGLSQHKSPPNNSDTSRKVINVNIKANNTKYLPQTTRNVHRNEM